MLTTRTPELMRRLLVNFDVLFNLLNFLSASVCLGASFGFDERAVAFLLVPFPLFFFIVLGDATTADEEFVTRRDFLLAATLVPLACAYMMRCWLGNNLLVLLVRLSCPPLAPCSLKF